MEQILQAIYDLYQSPPSEAEIKEAREDHCLEEEEPTPKHLYKLMGDARFFEGIHAIEGSPGIHQLSLGT